MSRTAALALVLIVTQAGGAEPVPGKPMPKKVGAMQIDFAPLADADMEDFKVTVVITTEKGARHEGLVKTQGKPGPRTIADSVKDTLHKGWDATLDETKLVIRGYKGSPVKSVKVEVIGLDGKYTPRVTRLPP